MSILNGILGEENRAKLMALGNKHVEGIVEQFASICKPAKISIITDSAEDTAYVRRLSLLNGEEKKLAIAGHTVHFDGYHDQARDKANTKILLPKGKKISKGINAMERDTGLREIFGLLDGIMKGKEMLVRFFCLGPAKSEFSIPALQLTDSACVAHNEDILYRQGYEEFKRLKGSKNFFYFVHSAGELENGVSKNIDRRRIYIDLEENRVFSVNNQYAGNSIGLKKLAMRLSIKKASQEGWLLEHMFIMGVHPPEKERVTYFAGAFPSACGKTSTAMLPGQTIVGDDIAFIRVGPQGEARAANVEQGIFGIIRDVNPKDDPYIYKALTTPREAIFSTVLVKDGKPYWLGMGKELPEEGVNYSGKWFKGKRDEKGEEITASHKNARYTIRIRELENADPNADNPKGVPISAFIYGGRDSDTSVPVAEAFNWPHGVFAGASLESETTAATLGSEGELVHNPMSNIDFLSVPLGTYIKSHLDFGEYLDKPPRVFSTNYFLKENGKYLNGMMDKKVWIMWMEGRTHNEFRAIETPIGYIPAHEDLRLLFKKYLGKDYTKEDYNKQFGIRIGKLLGKLDRIEQIFKAEENIPRVFWEHLKQQRARLLAAREKHGKGTVSPQEFEPPQ
jgi:phosphoenolpyruvate carboxykinase (GTP)